MEYTDDTKSLLKKAKDAISQKKYEEAQELCEAVLRKDKNNYTALVMLGASFQANDQAAVAFEKAITIKAEKSLAWQGLATYLEKKEDDHSKKRLVHVYGTLLKVDPNKFGEYSSKLCEVSLHLKDLDTVKIFYENYVSSQSDQHKIVCHDALVKLLVNIPEFNIAEKAFYTTLYEDLVQKESNEQFICNFVMHYTKLLDIKDSFKICLDLLRQRNSISELDEYVCKISSEYYIQSGETPDPMLENVSMRVLEMNPSSYEASLLKAMFLYNERKYFESYSILCPFVNSISNRLYGALVLAECCIQLNRWKQANDLIHLLSEHMTDNGLKSRLISKRVIILANQDFGPNLNEAVTLGQGLEKGVDAESLAALVKAYSELGNYTKAIETLDMIRDSESFKPLKAQVLRKGGELSKAKELLESYPADSYDYFMEIAIIYWELKEYEKCLNCLRKSAYLNSFQHMPFLYLGRYYSEVEVNHMKAKKCLLKAYQLNPECSEVALHLSTMHTLTNDDSAYLDVLKSAVANFGDWESWPHLRLGLYHMKKSNWNEAILNFHNVVKRDDNNEVVWECLSDAYYCRGSYHAALKCCKKIQTFSNSYYADVQIGLIYLALGRYKESLAALKCVKETMSPVIINKGLGECYLALAKEYLTKHLFFNAMTSAQNAIASIVKAIKVNLQYVSLWKILGDAIGIITQLPDRYCWYFIDMGVINNDDSAEVRCHQKSDMFDTIIKCFCNAVQLQPRSISFYYSLAIVYFEYYKLTREKSLLEKCLSVAEHCIKNDSKNDNFWNFYGVLFMHPDVRRYDLAQHSFVRSLRCKESHLTWTNLGMLYTKLNYAKLANSCFTHAQRLDPTYARSWMGQAFLAERLQPLEAADLFRHACSLGYHKESSLAFVKWICRIMDEKNCSKLSCESALNSVPNGIDLMTWYHEYAIGTAFSWTVCGLLQEQMGLLSSAKNSFKAAMDDISDDDDNISICLMNYGRILYRLGKYKEAIENFKKVPQGTMESVCGLALSLYKLEMYEQSYETYEAILEWLASSESEKANVLVAIVGIMHRLQGMSDAKPLILQSLSLTSVPSASSLSAAASLSVIHHDSELGAIVLDEIQKRGKLLKDSTLGYLVGLLQSSDLVAKGDTAGAIAILEKTVQQAPKNYLLWLYLLRTCFATMNTSHAKVFGEKALKHVEEQVNHTATVQIIQLADAFNEDPFKCLTLSKKAIRRRPDLVENWAQLVFSMIICNVNSDRIKSVVEYVTDKMNPSGKSKKWFASVINCM